MIIVRDVFQLKFGAAKPVKELMKESKSLMGETAKRTRVMFDYVGPAYTMVLELQFENMAEYEKESTSVTKKEEWGAWYQKFIPHVISSYKEVFTVLE